jgi:hypothetical protein
MAIVILGQEGSSDDEDRGIIVSIATTRSVMVSKSFIKRLWYINLFFDLLWY